MFLFTLFIRLLCVDLPLSKRLGIGAVGLFPYALIILDRLLIKAKSEHFCTMKRQGFLMWVTITVVLLPTK